MNPVGKEAAACAIRVIIPFYRTPKLVAPLFRSLLNCASELNELGCTVVAVNDSVDDAPMGKLLRQYVAELNSKTPCILQTNEVNLGFVKTMNASMRGAISDGCDVLLLNSDTVVFPGAFREMVRVSQLDSMIAFVSPRSNNATICTFPPLPEIPLAGPEYSHQVFSELREYLPDFHYVPTAVGFCLWIRRTVLKEIGLFDEEYGKGYNEENDLMMRANRLGYRAVLANWAFVHHLGEQSFSASDVPKVIHDTRNSALLASRYPEYLEHVQAWFSGPLYEAERLVSGFLTDAEGRMDIVFDCTQFGKYHNGTFNAARRVIEEAARTWTDRFNIFVIANSEAATFHEFHTIPGVMVVPPDTNQVFAAAFRFGQPFSRDAILRMSRIAPVNVYAMLDTIAWDCLYLNRDGLDELWRTVAQYADGLLYISDFNQDQFRHRFDIRQGMPEQVAYLSLDPAEYMFPVRHSDAPGSYYLVVGNAFAHKYVAPTVAQLKTAFPRTRIVAVGLDKEMGKTVTGYRSGELDTERLATIFAHAKAVIFPSTYEGFGIPTMEALASPKVVFVRDTPLNRAIRSKLGDTPNIVLYDCTERLTELLRDPQAVVWQEMPAARRLYSWAEHTADVRNLIEAALAAFSWRRTLLPRLQYLDHVKRASTRVAVSDKDAQNAVLECARLDVPNSILAKDAVEQFLRRHAEEIQSRMEEMVARLAQVSRADAHSSERQEAGRRVAELNSQIATLGTALADRETRIRELTNSMSWSITAPLRNMARHFMKGPGQ